jgi:hypothetical protein
MAIQFDADPGSNPSAVTRIREKVGEHTTSAFDRAYIVHCMNHAQNICTARFRHQLLGKDMKKDLNLAVSGTTITGNVTNFPPDFSRFLWAHSTTDTTVFWVHPKDFLSWKYRDESSDFEQFTWICIFGSGTTGAYVANASGLTIKMHYIKIPTHYVNAADELPADRTLTVPTDSPPGYEIATAATTLQIADDLEQHVIKVAAALALIRAGSLTEAKVGLQLLKEEYEIIDSINHQFDIDSGLIAGRVTGRVPIPIGET